MKIGTRHAVMIALQDCIKHLSLATISLISVSCDTAKLGEAHFCTFIVPFFALVLWDCCSPADEFRAVSQPTKRQASILRGKTVNSG